MTGVVHEIYFAKAFEAPARTLVEEMREVMDGLEFDTIIGTGLSGTVFAAKVADGIGVNFAILRKEGVRSHSSNDIEGTIGTRWVFGDDFVATGSTCARVVEYMRENHPECEFVGAYSYGEYLTSPARFQGVPELVDSGLRLANAILGRAYGPEPHSSWYRDTRYSYEHAHYVSNWDLPAYETLDAWLPENQSEWKWRENVARYPFLGPFTNGIVWVDNEDYTG
jgi:adenine/guanine phosphoribosyltransferase-like PRPP-binding protein